MRGRVIGVSLAACLAAALVASLPPLSVTAGLADPSLPQPAEPPDSVAAMAVPDSTGVPGKPDSAAALAASDSAAAPALPDSAAALAAPEAAGPPGPVPASAPEAASSPPADAEVDSAVAADSLGQTPREVPATASGAEVRGVPTGEEEILELGVLPVTDDFGFIAAWKAARPDSGAGMSVHSAVRTDFASEPSLERLRRRFRSRWFVREELGYRPESFLASDSLILRVDATIDSLVATGDVAEGVFYRSAATGGQRFIAPSLPRVQPKRGAAPKPLYTVSQSVDIDRALVTPQLLHNGAPVVRPVPLSYAQYMLHLTRVNTRRLWTQAIAESQQEATVQGGRAGLVRLTVPFEMPKAVKSIFGEGKPNLLVNGSEHISFGGKSQWFPDKPSYEFGRKQSKFPQLQMEQDLNIKLKGSVGDKLDIDVDQSSQAQSSLANRIAIHYKGYEDEIIRRVDLGNTSLSLPGTEYVSYGGKHAGLFGINSEAQLGPLTLNMIVSKQEGQTVEASTTIRSESKQALVYDYQYVRDRFFFLDDPTRDAYPSDPAHWVVRLDSRSVRVWLDDGDGLPNREGSAATRPGVAVVDLAGSSPAAGALKTGTLYFEELAHGIDYVLMSVDERYGSGGSDAGEVHPYIVLYRHLGERYTLGVTYQDEGSGQQVGSVAGDTLCVKMLRPNQDLLEQDLSATGWGRTARLMLTNVYSFEPGSDDWSGDGLPEMNILSDDLEISIHRDATVAGAEDPDQLEGVKLIRYLGLDYWTDLGNEYKKGQDGIADIVPWVDLRMGLIFFPDLRPFAPLDTIPDPELPRTYDLRGRPPREAGDPPWDVLPRDQWNRDIYDTRAGFLGDTRFKGTQWNSRFYIKVNYKTPVSGVRIDAYDIIEGSEVVTVGQRRLSKGSDYEIDYNSGDIRILSNAAITEDQEINVSYKRASTFGVASKSLLGVAAFYAPEDSKLKLSTSWLYERKSSPDRRPRLGSEPTRTAVGEAAASYRLESMGATRLLDRLPMLDARRPSTFDFEGGVGLSFPNPNTRNDLYIDDFEGVDDDISIRINRMAWGPCSVPRSVPGFDIEAQSNRRGELWWYTPYHAVQEGELNPTLDVQEANDYMQVLELQFFPYASSMVPPSAPAPSESWDAEESWGGIIQGLSNTKQDLTQARFLDIWVNDWVTWDEFQADPSLRKGMLHVEIGQMNENALWQRRRVDCGQNPPVIVGPPIGAPNDSLDYEDADRDGQLDYSNTGDEDTGLDRVLQGSSNSGNDYFYYDSDKYSDRELSDDEVCDAYSQINGTEHNGRLDSEDLDGSNTLDQRESYFEYRVALDDTSLVDIDVTRDYRGMDLNWPEAMDHKGWRRFRITLSDANVDSFINNPSWAEVKHLRLWVSGFSGPKRLQIASIQLRGNRWLVAGIQDSSGATVPPEELELNSEEFFPGVVNNKEDSDIYVAPFEEHRDRSQNDVREREQSLTLEQRNLQPGHSGRIYSELRGGSSAAGQNLMGYEYLEFYLAETIPQEEAAGVEFFVRLCKDNDQDSTNYYEHVIPLQGAAAGEVVTGWKKVKVRLTDLSDLKLLPAQGDDEYRQSEPYEDRSYNRMRGLPYLTAIERITLGVRNAANGAVIRESAVWIDELRLTHVQKDPGVAYRLKLNSQLSDFARVDLSYRHIGTDFTSISSSRSERASESAFQAAVSVPVERLTPRSARLSLPFTYNYSNSERVPKYRTSNDILVGEDPTDRDITRSVQRSASLGISRQRSESPWLRYSLDAFKVNVSHRLSYSQQPYGRDCTTTGTLQVGYGIDFGAMGDLRLHRRLTINPLPSNFSITLNRSETETERCERIAGNLSNPLYRDENRSRTTRTGSLSLSTGLRPIKPVTYSFSQSRDLKRRKEITGGLNIGSEVGRDENLTFTQSLRLLKGWVEPRLSWKGSFKGQFAQQQGSNLERSDNLSNDQSGTVSGDLPVPRLLEWLGGLVSAKGGSGAGAEAPKEPAAPPGSEQVPGRKTPQQTRSERSGTQEPPREPGGEKGGREELERPPEGGEPPFSELEPSPDEEPVSVELPGTRGTGAQRGRGSQGRVQGDGGGRGRGDLLGGILAITRTTGSYNNSKRSTYRKTHGEPSLAYQLGLSRDPNVEMLTDTQANLQDGNGYQIDADLRLLRRISVAAKMSHSVTEQRATGKTTGTVKNEWPDLDFRWGELSQWVNYHGWFRSVKASSRYTRTENKTLQEGNLSRRDVQGNWSPFLDLSVTVRNGQAVTLRIDRNNKTEETYDPELRTLGQTTEIGTTKVSLGTKRSFNITRTITMPLSGSQERLTTRLDLGLQVSYSTNRNARTPAGGRTNVSTDKRLFDFAVNGSYQFTKTVTGRVVVNFGEDANNANKTQTRRYVEVRLTAGFTF